MKSIAAHQIMKAFYFILFFSILFSFLPASNSWALPFGINKVRYHTDHHWKIFETEHFEIYYYPECEWLAKKAVEYAENAFVKTSQIFEFVPKNKIPLFVYGTGLEFQETNITPEVLPEGVGGFTEVFKNRIAVPMEGSYHEFEKVLHHELTHAFQYDLIYGEGWRSVNLFKAVFVPNWMMEGMAEWNAQHVDWQGEMVLRDAILNDQTIPLNLLESFDHFEQVYMAYKESESILDYVSQVYGPGKVVQLFKKMAANQQPDTAVKMILGVSLNDLYENWRFFMKSAAWSRIKGMPTPEKFGDKMDDGVSKEEVSPDGKTLAYLKGNKLVIWDIATKNKSEILTKNFQTQGSGLAWSPDGKFIAYSASENGEWVLATIEVKTRAVKERRIPAMPGVFSPCWSPDQKFLVFSGFDYSTVDLYRYELATGQLDRLTDNPDSESWASYSSDGKSIYFLRETAGQTSIQRMDLNAQGLPGGTTASVGGDLGQVSSFRLTPKAIYFTSNRDRKIFNLNRMEIDGGHITQLTDTFADVLSVAAAPGAPQFYVSLYQHAKEELYSFDPEKLLGNEHPPIASTYLLNSFEDASKIIPVNPAKDTAKEEASNFEKLEPEVIKEQRTPTQPPAALSRLDVIEASNIVQLQWSAKDSDSESLEGYRVYRSDSAGASFVYIGNLSNARQTRYVDYNVRAGGAYFYYVTAENKAGESAPSPVVEAHPDLKITSKEYHLSLSPDILLFVAGYDSSFGFVGGGVAQISDYLGDHRLGIIGDTIPSVRTGVEANYEFSQWRTTVDLDFYYYQNYFNIYDLQTGNIVNEYRNNENGFSLNFSYPLNTSTRFEYGIGTQRFLGSPVYLQFSEGISNYSQSSDQWNIANYYRLSFVKDQRKGTGFWPSGGYALNLTLLHALPIFDSNVSFANLLLETQVFADIGFLNHLVWANRFIAMTSQGANPQSFFIGNDAPFQAFFTTIRGYGGSTFFGSTLGLFNTELRYPLATNLNFPLKPLSFILVKDIELAGFLDVGIVSNQWNDLPDSPVLSSMGTGIRFYTFLYQRALVMFRFDVAWRLDQNAAPSFNFNLVPMF